MNSTFTVQLFLGFPVDKQCAHLLSGLDPHLYSSYINADEPYLQEISLAGVRYIGKNLGATADLADLELREANIYSLLKRVLPDYPWHTTPLVLLVVPQHDPS